MLRRHIFAEQKGAKCNVRPETRSSFVSQTLFKNYKPLNVFLSSKTIRMRRSNSKQIFCHGVVRPRRRRRQVSLRPSGDKSVCVVFALCPLPVDVRCHFLVATVIIAEPHNSVFHALQLLCATAKGYCQRVRGGVDLVSMCILCVLRDTIRREFLSFFRTFNFKCLCCGLIK